MIWANNISSMKKIILVYGLIAGAIVGGMMLITMPLYESGELNYENGELTGYTTMVVALSLVFFGIKSFRDHHANGVVSFGKAFLVGLSITLVASVMYAFAWEISFHNMAPSFIDKMGQEYVTKLKEQGTTEEEIKKKSEDFEIYKTNFPIRFSITLVEIFPIGLLISLISAGLLKRKEFLPASSQNSEYIEKQ